MLDNGFAKTISTFESNLDGVALRGADENGQCYWLKQPVYEVTPPQFTPPAIEIESLQDKLYLDDPVFTFEDDMLFGCSIRMSEQELENFCETQGWKNLVIKQNLYDLQYFGKSANAKPGHRGDWDRVTVEDQDKFDQGEWNKQLQECNLPSLHVVEVYYQKVNTDEDPKFVILAIKQYSKAE